MRHDTLVTGESIALTVADDRTPEGTKTITSTEPGTETPGIKSIADQVPISAGGTGINPVQGEFITNTLTLTGPGTSTPTLYRWTVRAIPMPFVAEVIQLPIILTTQTTFDERDVHQDIYDDYAYLKSLLENRNLALFIMGDETKNVYVSGVGYEAGSLSKWSDSSQRAERRRDRWPEGVLTVTLITVQTGDTLVPTFYSSTG
jgi:hypothetical protein